MSARRRPPPVFPAPLTPVARIAPVASATSLARITALALVALVALAAALAAPLRADEIAKAQPASAPGADAADRARLQAAVADYRAGRYEQAWSAFAELARAEPDAARRGLLHANAGTAAARADRLGQAIWHLEGARRLRPRDAAVATNLALVRARVGRAPSQAGQFAESLWRLPLQLTTHEAGLVVAGLVSIGLLLLAWRRAGARAAPPAGLALGVLLLAAGAWAFDEAARARDRRRAIVVHDAVALRAEPDRTGSINYRAGAGTVVVAEDLRDGWRLVETPEGARGWVDAEAVATAIE